MKLETTPPRGMRDVLPVEVELRDRAVSTILSTYRRYGFRRIETPALESLWLLQQSGGGENEKLIFKVLKRGAKLAAVGHEDELADLGLRFDLTVPLARYYAHNRAELPEPFKAVQIGPVWRAERPQKDRFRQFTQCDIDVLGEASGIVEIELILATAEALIELGLEHPRIRLNDRRILTAIATACGIPAARHGDFFITLDKLDRLGRQGVEAELGEAGHGGDVIAKLFALVMPSGGDRTPEATLERLGASVPGTREFVEGLTTIVATVRGEAADRFDVEFDPALVRGMGYYTGPIFEAMHAGSSSSIGGGGRYDAMLGRLLKQDVPACGFSIGFERVISILMQREQRDGAPRQAASPIALIVEAPESPHALAEVLAEAGRLRHDGRSVSLMMKKKNVARQLDELARAGFGGYAMYRTGEGALEVKPLVARTDTR